MSNMEIALSVEQNALELEKAETLINIYLDYFTGWGTDEAGKYNVLLETIQRKLTDAKNSLCLITDYLTGEYSKGKKTQTEKG